MPPTYFIVLFLLSLGLHFLFGQQQIILLPYTYLGGALVVSGIAMNAWSSFLFRKKKTAIKPRENPSTLIISGPFRISRHPIYLGMAMILFGTAILLGPIISFLFAIIFVVIMEVVFIPCEEKNLEKVFREEYLDYKQKVRRWI